MLNRAVYETVSSQVPENRRQEIERYLKLYGYKPENTILQVYVAGYLGKGVLRPKELAARERAAVRYGGRTFTIIGRTHDPKILDILLPPKKKPTEASPGYTGYLFMPKDIGGKAPHELLPLDFVPTGLNYPREWRNMFNTRGFLVAMHVPSDFARRKNEIPRNLRKLKDDPRGPWTFLYELEKRARGNQ